MSSNPVQTTDPSCLEGPRQGGSQVVNYRMRDVSGIPIPPYPVIGEAFFRYATAQQEAARARDYLFCHYNMEEDAFGFVRSSEFSTKRNPFRDQSQGTEESPDLTQAAGRVDITTAPSYTNICLVESVAQNKWISSAEGETERRFRAAVPYQLDSRPIISESDPEFREVAMRLSALRESDKTSTHRDQTRRYFRPSHMVLEEEGLIEPEVQDPKYLGDKTSKVFRAQRPSVPDHLNCALWLSNLPFMTREADLIQEIRTGAIYAVHIRPPKDGYTTAGVNVVFMKHSSAEAFLQQSETNGGIRVLGARIKVIYNKHGHLDYPHPERSRVLQIRGPAQDMTQDFWERYFRKCVKYQLSHVRQIRSDIAERAVLEFGFARFDGQADPLHLAINIEDKFRGIYEVVTHQIYTTLILRFTERFSRAKIRSARNWLMTDERRKWKANYLEGKLGYSMGLWLMPR